MDSGGEKLHLGAGRPRAHLHGGFAHSCLVLVVQVHQVLRRAGSIPSIFCILRSLFEISVCSGSVRHHPVVLLLLPHDAAESAHGASGQSRV